jgi:hypothetical protein
MRYHLGRLEPVTSSVALSFASQPWRHNRRLVFYGHCYATNVVSHGQRVAFVHHNRQPSASKISDPLHILFCGSDEFSCASLEALHHEHVYNPGLIQSISVVVRPGKRTGRGYKTVRDREFNCIFRFRGYTLFWPDPLPPLFFEDYLVYTNMSTDTCKAPIRGLAHSLGLLVHERDTFTGWNVRCREESAGISSC